MKNIMLSYNKKICFIPGAREITDLINMSLHLRKHVVVTDKDYDERTVCCFINP